MVIKIFLYILNKKITTFILILVFLLQPDILFASLEDEQNKEISEIVQHSVVNIIQKVKVSAEINGFDVDPVDFSVSKNDDKPLVVDGEYYIVRSGVLVSTDGYVLTNSHAVSDSSIKLALVVPVVSEKILESTRELQNKESDGLDELDIGDSQKIKLGSGVVDFVLLNSSFDIQKEIVVLNPKLSINKETLEEIFSVGLKAKVVYVNDLFYKDGDDLALLKVGISNAPSVGVSSGKFDVNTDFLVLESKSVDDFFKETAFPNDLIITRAKLHNGTNFILPISVKKESSGSAIFDKHGNVMGITSFWGDEFGVDEDVVFVIDNSKISSLLRKEGVVPQVGQFITLFQAGIEASKKLECEKASSIFDSMKLIKSDFIELVSIDSYIELCNLELGEKEENDKKQILLNIAIGFLLLVLVVIIFLFVRMSKKMKKMQDIKESLGKKTPEKTLADVSLGTNFKKSLKLPIKNKPAQELDSNKSSNILSETVLKSEKSSEGSLEDGHNDRSNDVYNMEKNNMVSEPSTYQVGKLGDITNQDKITLANLWPNKYNSEKGISADEVAEKDSVGVNITTDKVNMDVVNYIQNTLKLGFDNETIKTELVKAGWGSDVIEHAFNFIKK